MSGIIRRSERFSAQISTKVLTTCFLLLISPEIAVSQSPVSPSSSLRVVVNSGEDAVKADDKLTLREAIALINNSLPLQQLSGAEKALVRQNTPDSRIEFSLPSSEITIQLQQELPALTKSVVIDGTTQPGYNALRSATAQIAIPKPMVAITPALNKEIIRGLSVVADNVQIRGLSIYGFSSSNRGATLTIPPADIFIDNSRKNVVLENNWLGITPDEKMPEKTSAFGVYVFNSRGTTIRRNRISYHDGSGIITSQRAENTLMIENIIVGNGLAGMPDAVRLEGVISNSQLQGNLICGNDGAGVYLFKPSGKVQIRDNRIAFNGKRLRRAAVYLMGNEHQVIDNEISHQTGPGVVVTAFPSSKAYGFGSALGNVIQNNRFGELEGLSIDLNTQQNLDVSDFQRGDGFNPKRNTSNRRIDTGNGAVNAPEFASSELFIVNGKALINGTADAGSQVEIYRVDEQDNDYGPLSQPLATVSVDEKGKFNASLTQLQAGDKISAIATVPKYGTSEPAYNAIIRSVNASQVIQNRKSKIQNPQCVSAAPSPKPEPLPQPIPEPQPKPEPIRLKVPRIIHFALDKSNISSESATVLNRVVEVLRQYPFIVVEIEGHTDPRASDEYNLALGKRRASSVRNYLLKSAIAPERMTIRSLGETKPRSQGNSRIDTARDRRAELIFKDIRGVEIIIEEQENDLQIEPFR
ncbi:OmpA family protein [Hassallia byssoidea VB512170]|uniref:OmpA family protein n=1 Tax=Hassallia byssoidea VB512170 TaxID=1304833 RepID=A0A846HE51_9CYAN|nr:OmpA family protein [Hassalia byssoidea]NEU75059.1 OmpA family protein [Hassalia byssoidea VB512170]